MLNKIVGIFAVLSLLMVSSCNSKTSSAERLSAEVTETASQLSNEEPVLLSEIDGEELFQDNCAACHMGNVPKAPHFIEFQIIGADTIKTALTSGVMTQQAAELSAEEIDALAAHLGGAVPSASPVKMCKSNILDTKGQNPAFEGWGLNLKGTRFISDEVAKLPKADVSNLSLKWAFAYPGATRARSQPVYFADHLLVGSQGGAVYALRLDTGCATWSFQADTEVRNAINLAESNGKTLAMFGDIKGKVYAVDASTGKLVWQQQVSDHPHVTLTGSPRLYDRALYVPLSSKEWAAAADPGYECCTFRGGVVKLDIDKGSIVWTSFSIPETPMPTGKLNSVGARQFHAAGAPIWNSPTIDEKRGVLYVGTGEGYTSPAADTSDSVLAIDLETGMLRWHYQSIEGDAWNMACFIGGGPNCPEENGPDLDIGAPPIIVTLDDGKEIVVAGQKSGDVFALDPDNKGALLWRHKIGRGGFNGGVHWGLASNGKYVFAPIADTAFGDQDPNEGSAGLFALDPKTGETKWWTPAGDECAEKDQPACDPGLSAAVTTTSDVVFAGAFDGHLRAYDTASGDVIWDYNTNQEFETVNGDIGKGGAIESDGPVIINGHVVVNSGYLFGSRMPGNVLLVFSAKG